MLLRGGLAVVLGAASLLLWSCSDEDLDPTKGAAPGVVTTATPYAVLPPATIVAVVPPPTAPPTATPRPTATPTPAPARVTYRLAAGDNPSSVAARFGISTAELLRANNITNPSSLQIGQELVIPGATPTPAAGTPTATPSSAATPAAPPAGSEVYVVKSGDTAIDIASAFGITVAQLAAANNTTETALRSLQIGQRLTIPAP